MADAKKHILFIDDMECNRDMVALRLRGMGYQVTTLPFIEEVQAEAAAGKLAQYDAVITDLDLGNGKDGVTVARLVQETAPGMPVFLWSASAEFLSTEERALFTGVFTSKGMSVAAEMKNGLDKIFAQESSVDGKSSAPVLPGRAVAAPSFGL